MKLKKLLTTFLALILVVNLCIGNFTVLAATTGDSVGSGTTYYIDADNGDDSKDGTSPATAWKSFTNVSSLKLQAGQRLLLKAGCEWNDNTQLKLTDCKGSADAPVIVGRYGNGANPKINGWDGAISGKDNGVVHLYNCEYITVENLEVTNWDWTEPEHGWKYPNEQSAKFLTGIVIENHDDGDLRGITIQNNYVHDVNSKMAGGSEKGTGGILVTVTGESIESKYTDLKIIGNEVYKVCHEGIYMESSWSGERDLVGAGSYGKKWTGWDNVYVANNYVHEVAGDGIVIINAQSGTAEYNLVCKAADESWDSTKNPAHAGLWTWNCNNYTLQHNEVCHTESTKDGMAFDFDYGNQNILLQYNYSHDNKGGFLMSCPGPYYTVNVVARYNVSVNDGWGTTIVDEKKVPLRIIRVGESGSIGNQFYNNTIYWDYDTETDDPVNVVEQGGWLEGDNYTSIAQSSGTNIYNNIFCGKRGKFTDNDGVTYSNNCVYSYSGGTIDYPAEDTSVVKAFPSFEDVSNRTEGSFSNGEVTLGTVDGFRLKSGSPCIDKGMAYMAVPVKDDVPNGTSSSTGKNFGIVQDELVDTHITIENKDYFGNIAPNKFRASQAVDIGAAECDDVDTTLEDGEFYAYINVVGDSSNYDQVAKTLTRAATISTDDDWQENPYRHSDVSVTTPNYTDTNQIWHFIPHVVNGVSYYYIESYGTDGCVLNIDGGNATDNAKVHIADWYKVNNVPDNADVLWQTYTLDAYSGAVYIKPKKAIDDNNTQVLSIDGTDAKLHNLSSSASQAFRIYKINEVRNNKTAAIRNNMHGWVGKEDCRVSVNENNDVLMKTTPQTFTSSFMWTFERVQDTAYPPIYNIKNESTGKYLQVDSSGTDPSFSVSVAAKEGEGEYGSKNQQWLLLGDSLDALNFVPVSYSNRNYAFNSEVYSGYSIDNNKTVLSLQIPDWNLQNGQVLKTWASDYQAPESFALEDWRYSVDKGDFYSSIVSKTNYDYDTDSGYITSYFDHPYALSLTLDGKNATSGKQTNVMLRQNICDTADQTWYFRSLGDGTYVIRNLADGKVLQVSGKPTSLDENNLSGLGIETADYENKDYQKWYIVREPSGGYSICSALNMNVAIDIPSRKVLDNVNNLGLYKANDSDAQLWDLDFDAKTAPPYAENLGKTFWAYISPTDNSNQFIHCASEVSYGGSSVNLALCKTDDTKRKQENYWKFERKADGSYVISSCCLSAQNLARFGGKDFTIAQNRPVGTYQASDYDNAYEQRWFIRKYADGYRIESKLNGKVLFYTADSAISTCAKSSTLTNQSFNIVKTDLTIASALPNVKVDLFNYGNAINDADYAVLNFYNNPINDKNALYVDTKVDGISDKGKSPEMELTLNDKGYPQVKSFDVTNKSGSLQYLFDKESGFVKGNGANNVDSYNLPSNNSDDANYQSMHFTVNNPVSLFKFNEKNGMYYYDSLINAAYFKRDTAETGDLLTSGNFQLYDYTMSLANDNLDYTTGQETVTGVHAQNGNFYPFNIAHEEGDVDYGTTTDEEGKTIPASRPKVIKGNDYFNADDYVPVNYKVNNNSQSTNPSKIDCWFGMTMECDFEQTVNGQYNGKDVVFEFEGDDDVWVYLDGILILDMGGCHPARKGSINFRTGVVKYEYDKSDDPGDYYQNFETKTTDLKTLYEEAVGQSASGTEITNKFVNANINSDTSKGLTTDTLAAGTEHKLSFFYMERGGNISYCKLNFNLPNGSLNVSKEVDGLNEELTDNTDYEFKLVKNDDTAFDNVTYTVQNADGTSSDKKDLGSDGKFTLKAGQTAHFRGIPDQSEYKVYELNAKASKSTTAYFKEGTGTPAEVGSPNDIGDYVVGAYTLESETEHSITFKNTVNTSSLNINKTVVAADGTQKISMPDSVYSFGLRVYKGNNDYGTIKFDIPGSQLSNGFAVNDLPAGASYDLWEYYPTDTSNRYDAPTFEDDAKSGTIFTGRLVESSSTPSTNDVMTGTINGNTVTVKNTLLENGKITVTLKYYDRKVVTGEVANINVQETAFSTQVGIGNYVTYSDNGKTIKSIDFEQMIFDLGVNADEQRKITNVVDDYDLFTSQDSAVKKMKGRTYTLGIDDPDGKFATHYISDEQAVYHTNSKRQPINQEKWVTYYNQSNEAVDAEATNFIDFDKITNVTVWLYNYPKKYTVTTHIPDDSNVHGKTITFEAYYNQVLGSYEDNTNATGKRGKYNSEFEYYCDTYSIPKAEYDARSYVVTDENKKIKENNENNGYPKAGYEIAGAPEEFNNQKFSYWTLGENADSTVLSSDRKYNFRVTKNLDLYAQYGGSKKGVTTTSNGIDVYYTSAGAKKLRTNTEMNPYGFANGVDEGNPNIKEISVAYLTLNDSSTQLTEAQTTQIKTTINNTLNEAKYDTTGKFKTSYKVDDIGTISLTAYQIASSDLTNKNRVQFVANYNPGVKHILAFTALKYDDDNSANTTDNRWYLSDNYVRHELFE